MSYAESRRRMVEDQLRLRGIVDARVLDAMGRVPREQFVPPEDRAYAYDDGPLPIGYGQTISQPFTVAFMCQAARLHGQEKVMEVGTGSGYGAAVLSLLAREVHTVERIAELADSARRRLAELGYANVHVVIGDGSLGLPEAGPFDAIVVTAAAEALPDAYLKQLKPGGRIIIPIGPEGWGQSMCRFTRADGELKSEDLGSFAFVPLVADHK